MADKSIAELPVSSGMDDAALLPVYQNSQTQSIKGQLIRQYAENAAAGVIDPYITQAQEYAQNAANSAQEASDSAAEAAANVTQIGDSVSQAQASAQVAQEAQNAAESAKTAAQSAQTNAESAAQSAQGSASTASSASTAATASAETALSASSTAAASADAAEAAQSAAESAKTTAESAAQTAQSASTTATGKADSATQSASQAAQFAQDAQKAQNAIENMSVSAETLVTGQPASVEKSVVEGTVNLKFGLPTGATGAKGDPGNSIQKIERTSGTGAPGTTDMYTVTLTDGSVGGTFSVYNGANGQGAGDMLISIYDPQGKATDIYQYTDDAVANIQADDVTFADGETFQQKYDAGELVGPPGADGAQGIDGAAATITVGTVTTGEAGTSATVTNSGTSSAAVFNFTIPRGAAGSDGKSAYEYAQDAGYTGTEEELSTALASLGDLNSILDNINGEVV